MPTSVYPPAAMPPFEPFLAARPRRLRQSSAPKTPEPSMEGLVEEQAQPPSPPRPRFRLRRRAASQISAPTQHFLASVAAADVPVPSIEEPHVYDDDEDMLNIAYHSISQLGRIGPDHSVRGRTFSPPKTPAPGLAPSLSPKQFPDWSIDGAFSSLESSPEYESSRPSTARSTQTSSSLFSRFSLNSEELSQCASPENEQNDRFGHFLCPQDADKTIKPHGPSRHARLRRAPWTKAMSQHLWSTYLMYLQDPKVTPFRTGKSGIPPSGVCMRVAREAKRSWKGSRLLSNKTDDKSGSTTPTGDSFGPYMEWPHTCAATRSHLRELCKAHSGKTSRNLQNFSHSPTPFGKSVNRFWSRRSVPARSPSVFSGSDMAMSLTVCTSDSMQRQGPLALLTSSQSESEAQCADRPPAVAEGQADFSFNGLTEPPRGRLGSPFMARSYGPSSSTSWTDSFSFSPEGHRQNRTVGTRRGLGSPVRIDQSRSSTQKRRSRQSVLEMRRSKRPSLGTDFWTDPSSNEVTESPSSQFVEFSSTDSGHRDNLFVPRTNIQELFSAPNAGPSLPSMTGGGLTASHTVPARLGSPFSAKASSHSFPNRHSSVSSFDLRSATRPFATMHQAAFGAGAANGQAEDEKSPHTPSSARTSLANRLAYIDERLKTFRRRGTGERRSKSPCP